MKGVSTVRKLGVVMGLVGLAAAAAAPTASAVPPTFGPPVQLSPNTFQYVGVGDATGDGNVDVVLTPGANDGTGAVATVVPGRGDGTFIAGGEVAGATQLERSAIGDVTGDGIPDIVIAGNSPIGPPTGLRLLVGNGAGGFAASLIPFDIDAGTNVFTFTTDVAIADVTGDGVPEVLAVSFSNADDFTQLLVFRRSGGGFQRIVQTSTANAGPGPRAIAVGDVDGDGIQDVVTGATGNAMFNLAGIRFLKGNNSGNFATSTQFGTTETIWDVVIADLDRNGRNEVSGVDSTGGTVVLFRDDPATVLKPPVAIPVGTNPQHLASADLDGDGTVDLVASNASGGAGRVSILHGKGDATFDPPSPIVVGGTDQPGLAIGDVNKDDRPDLVVGTKGSGTPHVRLNTTLFPPASVLTFGASAVTQTTATLNGAVDTVGRRGSFHFELGTTTAYGTSTAELPLTTTPGGVAYASAVTGLAPNTTYHFRLVASTPAGGVALGGDSTFTTPPVLPTDTDAIALTRASFGVTWKVSKPSGDLVVRGTAREAGKVRVRLLRDLGKGRTRVLKTYTVTIAKGDWTRRLKVPASLLPGKHLVTLDGTVGTLPLVATSRPLTLPAPPEGVVGQAFASSVRNGPPALRLPGRRTQAHANFVFSVRPKKGRPIVARWFLPSGQGLAGVPKANATKVGAVVSAPGGLPSGRWRCELRVKGVLVAVVRVRIG